MSQEGEEKSAAERAQLRVDVRAELDKLERVLAELKVEFEQYFVGVAPFAPDKLHTDTKRLIQKLIRAPFKSSEMNYRLRMLEERYRTLNTYWMRVMKQREDGTYHKDVFKANMRERNALADAKSETAKGQAENAMATLFNSYKNALEQQSGARQKLNFEAFQKSLVKRAKEIQEEQGQKKVTFKVIVKDGKVTIKAKAK